MEQINRTETDRRKGIAASPLAAETPLSVITENDDPWDLNARLEKLQDAYHAGAVLLEDLRTELDAARQARAP